MARRPRNIVRYDHHHFHGWRVTLQRQGRQYERYFQDILSRRESHARAVVWRDKMLKRLPPPRKFQLHKTPSKTGLVGVYHVIDRTKAGRLVPRYVATWTDAHGQDRKRSFSVLKYGAARARALALDVRRRALADILGPPKPGPQGRLRRRSRA